MRSPPFSLHEVGELAGHRATVEVGGIGGDAFQRAREVALDDAFAGAIEIAVALENAVAFGEARQVLVVPEAGHFLAAGQITLARQPDRGSHDAREAEFAEMFLRVGQSRDAARHAHGQETDHGKRRDNVARLVQKHVGGRGGGSLLAEVEEGRLAVVHVRAGRGPHEHEPAAAEVARLRQHDRQREPHGHGGIDGVAARAQDFDPGVGRIVMDGDDHRVPGADARSIIFREARRQRQQARREQDGQGTNARVHDGEEDRVGGQCAAAGAAEVWSATMRQPSPVLRNNSVNRPSGVP